MGKDSAMKLATVLAAAVVVIAMASAFESEDTVSPLEDMAFIEEAKGGAATAKNAKNAAKAAASKAKQGVKDAAKAKARAVTAAKAASAAKASAKSKEAKAAGAAKKLTAEKN